MNVLIGVTFGVFFVAVVIGLMCLVKKFEDTWYEAARGLNYLLIAIVTATEYIAGGSDGLGRTLTALIIQVSVLEFLANIGAAIEIVKRKINKNNNSHENNGDEDK